MILISYLKPLHPVQPFIDQRMKQLRLFDLQIKAGQIENRERRARESLQDVIRHLYSRRKRPVCRAKRRLDGQIHGHRIRM